MSGASHLEKTKLASSLLPAIFTLVCLAAAELPKSESTAPDPPSTTFAVPISNCSCLNVKLPSQDVVNCSHVTVAFLLQSLRSIDICITTESPCTHIVNKTMMSPGDEEETVQGATTTGDESDVASTSVVIAAMIDMLRNLTNVLSSASLDVSATIDLSPSEVPPKDKYRITCHQRRAALPYDTQSIVREQLKRLTTMTNIPLLQCASPTDEKGAEDRLKDVLHTYVDPAVHTVIFALGLVWNGVLVLIFVREKQLWTPPNAMLFNLALADLISLVWNVLAFCLEKHYKKDMDRDESVCMYHVIARPMSIALGALSVGALSIIRYIAIVHNFTVHTKHKLCKVSTKIRYFFYLAILWLLALALAYPYTHLVKFTPGNCDKYGYDEARTKALITSEFVFYCAVLPAVMVVFNALTVRKLKQSVRDLSSAMKKNRQDEVRHRSANMLMVFMAIFLVTYVPHYVLRLLRFWNMACDWQLTHLCLYKVSYYLLFSNLCFNPISLYLVSGTFRTHYNYYFLQLFRQQQQRKRRSQVAY